jgi:hypothetical protein
MLQSGVASYEDYRQAAALLWGAAGDFAAAEFGRLNRMHFAGSIPPLPITIGLAPYGRCLGLTRSSADWLAAPRIGLATEAFTGSRRTPGGRRMVADVLVHEMVHAALMLRAQDPGHNSATWCRAIAELSPAVLGHEVDARPVLPRRIPNPARETDRSAPKTIVVRRAEPGSMTRADLARWPHSARPDDYYQRDEPMAVPTF